jgi:hypothetical protein
MKIEASWCSASLRPVSGVFRNYQPPRNHGVITIMPHDEVVSTILAARAVTDA